MARLKNRPPKHSSAHWRAANCAGRKGSLLRHWGIFDAAGSRVATLDSPQSTSTEKDAANAALIAAAPELRAALRAFCLAYAPKNPAQNNYWEMLDLAHEIAVELLNGIRD